MNKPTQTGRLPRNKKVQAFLAFVIAIGMLAPLPGCSSHTDTTPHRLNKLPDPPPVVPERRDVPLDMTLQQAARDELAAAAASPDPIIRAHAIEAMRESLGTAAADNIIKHFSDPSSLVRFSATVAAGELRLAQAKEGLLVLSDDSDPSVRVGAKFALHRLGDTRQSHDLETASRDPSPRTRGDTAMVLGLLGEPTASRVLVPMLHDANAAVRVQAAEALWRLGDPQGLDELIAGCLSQHPDDQMVAILALAGPKNRNALGHIEGQLTNDYPEVELVAARAAGMLGSDSGYGVALKLIEHPVFDKKDDPEVIARRTDQQHLLAALAFGAIGRSDAQPYLAPLLKDPNADVRVAAAQALLQLKS